MAFFGVNFILQKFCSCKKNDKYQVCFAFQDVAKLQYRNDLICPCTFLHSLLHCCIVALLHSISSISIWWKTIQKCIQCILVCALYINVWQCIALIFIFWCLGKGKKWREKTTKFFIACYLAFLTTMF